MRAAAAASLLLLFGGVTGVSVHQAPAPAPSGVAPLAPAAETPPAPGEPAKLTDAYGLYSDLSEFTCAALEPLVQKQCGKAQLYEIIPHFAKSLETCQWAMQNWPELKASVEAHFTYKNSVNAVTNAEIETQDTVPVDCHTFFHMWEMQEDAVGIRKYHSEDDCQRGVRSELFPVKCGPNYSENAMTAADYQQVQDMLASGEGMASHLAGDEPPQ